MCSNMEEADKRCVALELSKEDIRMNQVVKLTNKALIR